MKKRQEKITIIGTLNTEIILGSTGKIPQWGKQIFLENLKIISAGSAVRVAFPLAKLGVKSYIIGVVGDDIYGREIIKTIRNYGLSTRGIEVVKKEKTGICVSLVKNNGERLLISHLGSLSCFDEKTLLKYYSFIQSTDYLLLTGYFTLPGLEIERTKNIFKRAKREGKIILIDPAWDPREWTEKIKKDFLSLLKYVDIFLPNEQEAFKYANSSSLEKTLKELFSYGPKEVIIKLGNRGSCGINKDDLFKQKAFSVKVIDTTAAGEVFNAGIIYGLINGWDMGKRLRYANALTSLFISKSDKKYPATKQIRRYARNA